MELDVHGLRFQVNYLVSEVINPWLTLIIESTPTSTKFCFQLYLPPATEGETIEYKYYKKLPLGNLAVKEPFRSGDILKLCTKIQ